MAPRDGAPRPKARSSRNRGADRSSSPTPSDSDFTPSTREWLHFLAGLLARAAREQHPARALGVDPVRDQPTS